MKKFILAPALVLAILITMQSCQKDVQQHTEMVKEFTIDTTITADTNYTLNLAKYGDEGDVATIIEPAIHASISQIDNQTDMFTSVYHYTPAPKTTGNDEVTISIKHYNGNQVCGKDSTIIYINLTIK